jgi:hypothetical protein
MYKLYLPQNSATEFCANERSRLRTFTAHVILTRPRDLWASRTRLPKSPGH